MGIDDNQTPKQEPGVVGCLILIVAAAALFFGLKGLFL
jgi:hypothetical protein